MNLARRVLNRSGELVYSESIDGGEGSRDPRLDWLADWVGDRMPGASIVDVGCWTGTLIRWAIAAGAASATGIDLPGPWLDAARSNLPQATWLQVSSIEELPDGLEARFDVVFFLETLEHLPRGSEAPAFRALRRLLAPGGILVCSTPLAGPIALADPAWLLVGHRHYRPRTLTGLLKASALQVDELRYSGNACTAATTNLFYAEKHLLRRPPARHPWLERRADTGLRFDRQVTSTTVWLRAGLAAPEESSRR